MSDGPVLGGALPPLHRYAACTNVAAACASAAFQVFPCRNSYRDILAFSGLCFSFDAYRWHQDHEWGFGGNEFLDEHWDDVARATGVRLRRYPGGREGSPLAEHREEILRGFAAGLPLIGQAAGACPFAVGVGCAEDAPPMQLWWNVRFVAYGAVTETNGLFRAPGTALALLQGYEPPAWSPEEEVRHCLRASGAVRAPLDLGWGEIAYGANALRKMAEDLTRLAELSGQARECFLVYSYNHLAKFADFREQAHGYLQTALPGLSGALRTVARELSSIYQEQRERVLAEFGGMLRFQTVTEFGDQQSAFAEGWSEYRPRLRTLWNALAEPELRVGELIRTVV